MECKRFESLIALYIEGDLDARACESVRTHLNSCAGCRFLQSEFAQSQAWLRSVEPPNFDPEYFDQLRHSVQQRISIQDSPIQPTKHLWGGLTWKPVLSGAAAALVILLACAAGWRHFTRPIDESRLAAPERRPSPEDRPHENGLVVEWAGEENGLARQNSADDPMAAGGPAAIPDGDIGSPKHPGKESRLPPRPKRLWKELPTGRPADTAEVEAANRDRSVPIGSPIRIEMQTSDPNIRIIWLTPAVEGSADELDVVTK